MTQLPIYLIKWIKIFDENRTRPWTVTEKAIIQRTFTQKYYFRRSKEGVKFILHKIWSIHRHFKILIAIDVMWTKINAFNQFGETKENGNIKIVKCGLLWEEITKYFQMNRSKRQQSIVVYFVRFQNYRDEFWK